MAAVAGKGGSITWANMSANAHSWAITYEADELDKTDFVDAGVSDYIAGLTRWGGTVELHWDSTNTAVVGTTASAVFKVVSAAASYSGSILFTREETTTPTPGIVATVATFRGKEGLTKPT